MKRLFLIAVLVTAFSSLASPISAKSWVVSDNGQIVAGVNTKEVRSIASITKLMTVMVFLDANKSLTSKTDQELIQRAIVSSDNHAANRLCESYPGGKDDCIFMMNLKAKELGLNHTKFIEPTGLSVFNVSNTEDLVKLVHAASKYPEIVKASHTAKRNTNPLVAKKNLTVSKTGFINAAGGCIVLMQDQRVVVILGSKNTHTRIPEADALLKI
jgi:D-alanyl-D-alanine endopeptidase (penicillin-binding protein 7)